MNRSTIPVRFSFNCHFISLVWNKAVFNLKSETNKTHLSYCWWVMEPVLYMAVFYVVFGLILQRGGPDFIPYLLTGLVPFQWLSKSIVESADSILKGRGLMLKLRINPLFFPLSRFITSSLKEIPVFVLLVAYLLISGYNPGLSWLALPLVLLLQVIFTIGICFLLSFVIPYFRDLLRLVPLGIQFILFGSGVFYTIELIPPHWVEVFFLNPVACLLHFYRQIFLHNNWPDLDLIGYVLVFALVLLLLTVLVYRYLASSYAKVANE